MQKQRFLFAALIASLFGLLVSPAYAVINLASSSTEWTAVAGDLDYHNDQQTGQGADDIVGGDIVGDDNNPAFLTRFEDNASGDDFIAFRARMNRAENQTDSYDGYFWVAVEANGDGVVDAYIRATTGNGGQNPPPEISIHSPGTFDPGRNISPNTTDITSAAAPAYIFNDANYMNYRAVDPGIDGPGTLLNVDPGDTNDDWYVSIQLPFQSLQAFLLDSANNGGQSIATDLNTPFRYLSATSTQGNSFNQDIGGLDGNVTGQGDVLWTTDGFTDPMTPTGMPIPESGTTALLGLCGLAIWMRRRRLKS